MIDFVNAKINIGLQVVSRREDGYHDLQTVFYPVGRYAGLPQNPEEFCDILEISCREGESVFEFQGRKIDCPLEKNLIFRAVRLFEEKEREREKKEKERGERGGYRVILDKHLPDGAGMGGGSADASFALRMLNRMQPEDERFSDAELAAMALRLGADCPFFIYNRPMYAEGVGERLEDIALDLSGYWLVVIKPRVYVSTKEAFSGIVPKPGDIDLRELPGLPVEEWQGVIINDFEVSIFPRHPELKEIKESLLHDGALYASMSGSGSSIYGIFREKDKAHSVVSESRCKSTIEASYLLEL